MKFKWSLYWKFIVGIFLFVLAVVVAMCFENPFSCSISGVGCSSLWELLVDDWSHYVAMGLGLVGGLLILSRVGEEFGV